MTFGMPTSMFLVFVLVVAAGSLGAIHYVVVHVLMGRPFADETGTTTARQSRPRTVAEGDAEDHDAAGPNPPPGAPEWRR